jgi:membrane protease YdiL (CAAX protease family)
MEMKIGRTKGYSFQLNRVLIFLFAFLLFSIIDRSAIYLTDIFLAGSFGYIWLSVHHVIQIIMAVLIMALPWWRRSLSDWGFNLKNVDLTFRIILKFTIGWVIFSTLFIVAQQWLSGWPKLLEFRLNASNILIYLFFEFIIVGISEEIVFRGLVYGTLYPFFSKKIKIGFTISYAGIITAVFFAVAHIGYQFFPFAITSFAPMQVFMALALGLFYAVLREKTGSLLGPILAHNISDGWLSILYILIQTLTSGN